MAEDQTYWRGKSVIQNQKIKPKEVESQDESCRANKDKFLGSQQARLEGQNQDNSE